MCVSSEISLSSRRLIIITIILAMVFFSLITATLLVCSGQFDSVCCCCCSCVVLLLLLFCVAAVVVCGLLFPVFTPCCLPQVDSDGAIVAVACWWVVSLMSACRRCSLADQDLVFSSYSGANRRFWSRKNLSTNKIC